MRNLIVRTLAVLLCLSLLGCSSRKSPDPAPKGRAEMQVTSPAFNEGGMIPRQYTCDGANVSPPLSWSGFPAGTKWIALICDDPDAPNGTWVHWVLYDWPLGGEQAILGSPPGQKVIERGAKQGVNDFGKIGYGGPCPPSGTHRYYFKLYALDKKTDLPPGATKQQVLKAMEGHILAQGQLMGRYSR
jgi:Raf kinase inhibitor-like YbhB/YbcL family protein